MLGEKRKDTWIYEDKKYKVLEKSLKNKELYLPKHHDTTTTKFANRACAVHGISLPVVVDRVVVVVLKFPNKELLETVINALVFRKLYYSSSVWSSPSLPEMFVTYNTFKTLSREVFAS